MPDLLLEFFSEEIPARMQQRAAEDLKKLITDRLVAAGLAYEGATALATPRRLALTVVGVPARSPDIKDERKGPRVGSNEKAIAGFLKAAGLASIEQAKVQKDPKGDFYVAMIEKPGRPAIEVIAEIVPEVTRSFPWPKSMRWGAASAQPGALTWVRPLHSIVATFGPETEEPEVVRFNIGGIASGDVTQGHRFMAPAPINVRRFDDYVKKLADAKVVVDPARRREIILADAKNLAFAQGYELVEDQGLLAEVAGLVEWPVVLMGSFDAEFLKIPEEVIRATIRNNQKCFVLTQDAGGLPSPLWGGVGGGGPSVAHGTTPTPALRTDPPHKGEGQRRLAPKFIMVANIEASDHGKAIVAGCERVIRARLSDAKFFYETDLKTRLEDRLPKFEHIVFHEKLGTQAERIARIVALAGHLAPLVGADVAKAERAAQLCKADLLTEVVGEFPELQGLMGRYYAEAQGEDEAVAHACEDHYSPKGPDDMVPSDPVSVAVALADKIDILCGFWAIDEKPTGSKDPYALRRAALGAIRLCGDNRARLRLRSLFFAHWKRWLLSEAENLRRSYNYFVDLTDSTRSDEAVKLDELEHLFRNHMTTSLLAHGGIGQVIYANYESMKRSGGEELDRDELTEKLFASVFLIRDYMDFSIPERRAAVEKAFGPSDAPEYQEMWDKAVQFVESLFDKWSRDLLVFFADRLKVQLREQGARHDLVDAVFALEGQDDLLLIVRRVEALGKFLDTDDGKNLLAGTKRAANILRIEEKKDNKSYTGAPDAKLLNQAEEKELARAIGVAKAEAAKAVAAEDFAAAMSAMAKLRPHVDRFFDKVTVNVDDKALRENRLKLLNEIREATRAVADFSKIEG